VNISAVAAPRVHALALLQIHHDRGAYRSGDHPRQIAALILAIERRFARTDFARFGDSAIAGGRHLRFDFTGNKLVADARGERLGGEIYMGVDHAGNRRDGFFDSVRAIRAMHAANSETFDLFVGRAFGNVLRVHGRAQQAGAGYSDALIGRPEITSSISPYSTACAADMKLSRSVSFSIFLEF